MQRNAAIGIGLAIVVLAAVIGLLVFPRSEDPSSGASPSAPASAEPSASSSLAADLLDRRWTVLYVGTDLNEGREQDGATPNTDALMLVSVSADQSELTLLSLPRDTVDMPLAGGDTWQGKINSLFRDRGIDELRGAMETLYGVPVDAHVVLDMDDFSRIVDAAGGIEVSPPEPLVDPIVDLDLQPGDQMLDGPTTLNYVRTRVDQDYGRMGRQQEVLVNLVEKLVAPDTELDLRQVLDSLESLETDLPLDQLPTLLELARRASDADVRNVLIEPPLITFEGDRADGRGYILEPDIEAIRTEVQGLIGE